MLYATVNDGYRSGGVNAVVPCEQPLNPNIKHNCLLPNEIGFKPDRTRNYEVGLRSTFFDKRLTWNTSVYYIKWKDIRIEKQSTYNQGILVNGGRALSQGIETQFQAALPYRFSLIGNYSYNDAKMAALAPGLISDLNGRYDALRGDRLPDSPQHMGSLNLQYARSLPADYLLSADYGISAQSNIYSTIGLRGSGEKIPGYIEHETSVGLSKNGWHASLFAENLFNKYAFTGVDINASYLRSYSGIASRQYFHSVLRPRRIGAEIRVDF
jgi:outer membrane receptor protein involved in Fe transport